MSSPQEEAYLQAADQDKARLAQAYGIALPALGTEYGALDTALAQGGEPAYLKSAYEESRGAERGGAAVSDTSALRASNARTRGAAGAGNLAALSPHILGSSMAQALYGNRVQEASGQIEQMSKLFGASLGQAQQTGSGALAATGNQLANISGMQPYNSAYAGILGALNLGGSLYGAGAFGSNPYSAQGYGNPSAGFGNPYAGAGSFGT